MAIRSKLGIPVLSEEEMDRVNEGLNPLLAERMAKGEPFTRAVFAIYEEARDFELSLKGIEPACNEGCRICCQQTFLVSRTEFEEMVRGFEQLDSRNKYSVQKKARRMADHWLQYLRKLGRLHCREVADLEGFKRMVLEFNHIYHVSCPFFSDRDSCCLIYPHRPFECRACVSTILCNEEGGSPVYFVSDFWPGTALAKYEMEQHGNVSIHPLPNWLSQHQLL